MAKTLVYQELARKIDAYKQASANGNDRWKHEHEEAVKALACDYLPSGSGFDSGIEVDLDASDGRKDIVLIGGFHRMNEEGFYAGWVHFRSRVTPDLAFGINIALFDLQNDSNDADLAGLDDYICESLDQALRHDYYPPQSRA